MNAETREMRMLLLASIPPDILMSYLASESIVNVNDHNSFPGETISFTPSKEELRHALESAKFMKEADSIAESKPKKALKKDKEGSTPTNMELELTKIEDNFEILFLED